MGKSKNQTRFRLKPEVAVKLGLTVNRGNRYRLNKRQLELYSKLDMQPIKRLFYDLETSPNIGYFWRAGYKLNVGTHEIIQERRIICISWKWEEEDKVHNLTWDENQCDKQMLVDFMKVANQADEIIAHNGDRFDIKWLRTRCIFHRIPMFPHYRSLDTLKKAKAHFNFQSNRLDYIARFLGVGAKVEHEGWAMWKKCMEGNKQALKDMVHYCDGDIVVLEDVFTVMQNYIKHNTHAGTLNKGYKFSCPTCGSEDVKHLKNNFTALGTIKRQMQCNTCDYGYETSNSAYKIFLEHNLNKIQ